MQEEFEKWYVSKFLNLMSDAKSSIISLRNSTGGYDDHHIDGAWECWKCKYAEWNDSM